MNEILQFAVFTVASLPLAIILIDRYLLGSAILDWLISPKQQKLPASKLIRISPKMIVCTDDIEAICIHPSGKIQIQLVTGESWIVQASLPRNCSEYTLRTTGSCEKSVSHFDCSA